MKIAFVDEDEDQRETYRLMLQECIPEGDNMPIVQGYAPLPQLVDMRFLVENEDIVTIILDEQLKESGVAQYFGIELASYLRTLNKKIPIYILTSYPESEELHGQEITVEDILNKLDLPKTKEIIGARILRRVDTFLDISTNREIRFELLLRKSIGGEISQEEKNEMIELGYLRDAPFEVGEILSADRLRKVGELEKMIISIEQSLSEKK